MKKLFSVTLALLVFFSVSTQAAFVQDVNFFTDTTTNLEWLHLTETMSLTPNEAISTFGSDRWEVATQAQIQDLFVRLLPTANGLTTTNNDWALVQEINNFRGLFGDVRVAGPGYMSRGVAGSLDPSSGFDLALMGVTFYEFSSARARVLGYNSVTYATLDYDNNDHGTYMVRPVPIPASILLLGLPLLGLGMVATRKK